MCDELQWLISMKQMRTIGGCPKEHLYLMAHFHATVDTVWKLACGEQNVELKQKFVCIMYILQQ